MKNNHRNENYFTRKRIILFTFLTILILVFIVLFSKFVLDIDFNTLGKLVSSSIKNKESLLWFFLLFIFPIWSSFWRCYMFKIKLKEDNIFVKWYDWLSFGFMGTFINSITPFAMGCEPYNIFWLKSKGVSLRRATIIVSSTFIFGSFSQILITWPSYFYITSLYPLLSYDIAWKTSFWLATAGLFIDLISIAFFWTLSYSRRVHCFINFILNWFKKKFKMKYKTKDEIKNEFISNAVFKREFLNELKKIKHTIILLLGNLLWNIFYYISLFFSFKFLYTNTSIDFWQLFNYVNISVTANNFIPIPGAEGTLQLLLSVFLNKSDVFTDSSSISSAIFIWRLFSSYIPTLIGILTIGISIYLSIKNSYLLSDKSNKKLIKQKFSKNPSILVLIQQGVEVKNIDKQTYKNIKLLNIKTNTRINELLIWSKKYDYFIIFNKDTILHHRYFEQALINSEPNFDLSFLPYTEIKKFLFFKLLKDVWCKSVKNKNNFIYSNNIELNNVLINSSYFYNCINKSLINEIYNSEWLIYWLFYKAKNISMNKKIFSYVLNNKNKTICFNSLNQFNRLINNKDADFRLYCLLSTQLKLKTK